MAKKTVSKWSAPKDKEIKAIRQCGKWIQIELKGGTKLVAFRVTEFKEPREDSEKGF